MVKKLTIPQQISWCPSTHRPNNDLLRPSLKEFTSEFSQALRQRVDWVVVSNIFYFHPYLENSHVDSYFSSGLKPPTRLKVRRGF